MGANVASLQHPETGEINSAAQLHCGGSLEAAPFPGVFVQPAPMQQQQSDGTKLSFNAKCWMTENIFPRSAFNCS